MGMDLVLKTGVLMPRILPSARVTFVDDGRVPRALDYTQ